MKKIFIVAITLLFLTGCGMTDEEKENMLYKSLEKAYTAVYASEGVGLAVYPEETVKIDEKDWYLVAISGYKKVEDLTSLADAVYTDEISKDINKIINEKYKESDTGLYTTSEGGCTLPYQIGETIDNDNKISTIDSIKKDVKIKKIKMNKIVFEYKGKEYEGKKSKDNYVFDDKIFYCETGEN